MKRARRVSIGPRVALLAGAVACAAPASEPATGQVATDVQRSLAGGTARFEHAEWARLLAGGTSDGLVDYDYMAAERPALDRYLDEVARADLAALASDELKALLINAYNALTVRTMLDHPGVSSIRDIDGVWTSIRHTVGGHELTLDNIEHNLLRPFFKDPRIHFAVNCASMSCAPLPPWAFTGDALERQLEERTRSFLTDPRNVEVRGGGLAVSRYFDWYGDDFTAEGWEPRSATIPEFIAHYSRPEVRDLVATAEGPVRIEFLDYDWSLNGATGTTVPAPASARGAEAAPSLAGRMAARVRALAVSGLAAQTAEGPRQAGESTSSEESEPGFVARLVRDLRAWVSGFGPAAPLIYGLAYAVLVVLLVPGSAITIGAGLAFGLGLGTVVVSLASTLGACLAFLIARYLLRSRVEQWLRGRDKLSAIDRAVEQQGWRVVALTRLSPVFPFNVQNYFYGLTGVGFGSYALASWIAMLPGTLLYVYIGVAGAGVAEAAGGAAGMGETALLIAGLAATLVVVALITRVARRELEKATGSPERRGAPGTESMTERQASANV